MCISQLDEMITERTPGVQSDQVTRLRTNVTRIGLIALVCALLVSCLPLGTPEDSTRIDPNWSQILKGRFIYKSPEESFSAVFTWKSNENAYELLLRDRLGLRRIRILGSGETADIETPNGQTLEEVDVQAWLEEQFSVSVPLLELLDCLTMDCSFVKSGQNHVYDEQDRLVEFNYDAWTVQAIYDSRKTEDSNVVKEIQMLDGSTTVRMIFDS